MDDKEVKSFFEERTKGYTAIPWDDLPESVKEYWRQKLQTFLKFKKDFPNV